MAAPYATRYLPEHPLAMRNGSVAAHRLVLYETLGPGDHPCHWCERLLYWHETPRIVGDHLNGDGLDNRPENLVASCRACNRQRDDPRILRPGELFVTQRNGRRRRAREIACAHCGETTLVSATGPGRFCSKRCSGLHQASRS